MSQKVAKNQQLSTSLPSLTTTATRELEYIDIDELAGDSKCQVAGICENGDQVEEEKAEREDQVAEKAEISMNGCAASTVREDLEPESSSWTKKKSLAVRKIKNASASICLPSPKLNKRYRFSILPSVKAHEI